MSFTGRTLSAKEWIPYILITTIYVVFLGFLVGYVEYYNIEILLFYFFGMEAPFATGYAIITFGTLIWIPVTGIFYYLMKKYADGDVVKRKKSRVR